MRILALTLALSACGIPFKYQVFDLPAGHRDVIWVFQNNQLYRCSAPIREQPRCIAATFLNRAPPIEFNGPNEDLAGPLTQPDQRPAAKDLRPLQ